MPAPETARSPGTAPPAARPRVALVTLGCARNEVDSEELAGRLAGEGWELVDDAAAADVALVNTCGFVEAAKKDSVDTLLEAASLRDEGGPRAVVAVGCLAERYGDQLARALPEADAVLGFDDYTAIAGRLRSVLAGERLPGHSPRDRRTLLPLAPIQRHAAPDGQRVAVPGHGSTEAGLGRAHPARPGSPLPDLPEGRGPASGPRPLRRRLGSGPTAPLKLASGCDRRCAFCAIPSFRGSFLSRPPQEVLAEARWLAGEGVRELVLVSENSTSYGKDLGDLRLLEALLPELAAVAGIERVRVSYLQPAEMRPSLLDVLTGTAGVLPYFDLSFQHASAPVLRRMRRFGDTGRFLALLEQVRARAPQAGIRSNFIVGFPGETERDVAELEHFLVEARLDATGVFGYSDEEGTEAAGLEGKLDEGEVRARAEQVGRLAEELSAQRAEERRGTEVSVLVEAAAGRDLERSSSGPAEGRAEHQAPEVDGSTLLLGGRPPVGALVTARVVGSDGVDLLAEIVPEAGAGAG